jgi:hypothetical protein
MELKPQLRGWLSRQAETAKGPRLFPSKSPVVEISARAVSLTAQSHEAFG